MRLLHYTNKELKLKPRKYKQVEEKFQSKPNGLWVSIEGEYDWEWFWRCEEFKIEYLRFVYEITLKESSKTLILNQANEIFDLAKKYPIKNRDYILHSD